MAFNIYEQDKYTIQVYQGGKKSLYLLILAFMSSYSDELSMKKVL